MSKKRENVAVLSDHEWNDDFDISFDFEDGHLMVETNWSNHGNDSRIRRSIYLDEKGKQKMINFLADLNRQVIKLMGVNPDEFNATLH